jgi:uncharacterized protein (TIGR03905 family)
MTHTYKTKNTCSSKITFELDGDIVRNIEFVGGCNGNLTALQKLLDGSTVSGIEEACGGIKCGRRPTSCTDQLSIAVRKAFDETNDIAEK